MRTSYHSLQPNSLPGRFSPSLTPPLCPTNQVVEPWARCTLGIESWVGTASSLFLCPSIQIPNPRTHIKDSHVEVQRGSRRFEKKWGAAMLGNSTPLLCRRKQA